MTWNFHRQDSNHLYIIDGKVSYNNSENNVVISNRERFNFDNVKDVFMTHKAGRIELASIFDVEKNIERGARILSDENIHYNTPQAIARRKLLTTKDESVIIDEVKQHYGIDVKTAQLANTLRTSNGMFFIESEDARFVLKYRGEDKQKAELESKILAAGSSYLPTAIHRTDANEFTFNIGNELYGLESLVPGQSLSSINLDQFATLGRHIAKFHSQLAKFVDDNDVEKALSSRGYGTSESNVISTYLDLQANPQHRSLLPSLDTLVAANFTSKLKDLPKTLIHGDLNQSNLLWSEDSLKMIDAETARVSSRIHEFVSPLIFLGNMTQPNYVIGSMTSLVKAYNSSAECPLTTEERHTLPQLLAYTLLKNYVIRSVRRGLKEDSSNTTRILSDIGDEANEI